MAHGKLIQQSNFQYINSTNLQTKLLGGYPSAMSRKKKILFGQIARGFPYAKSRMKNGSYIRMTLPVGRASDNYERSRPVQGSALTTAAKANVVVQGSAFNTSERRTLRTS